MASIRKTRTCSGATAVQVVRYVNRRAVVLKHMGSANDWRNAYSRAGFRACWPVSAKGAA
jgi:hypothetical protein